MNAPRLAHAPALAAILALAGCATLTVPPFPEPIREPKAIAAPTTATAAPGQQPEGAEQPAALPSLAVSPAPGRELPPIIVEGAEDPLGQDLQGPPIEARFSDAPLIAFINEIFAERLGLSFHIAPNLQGRPDLVTFVLADAVPPRELFASARQVLRHYGVDIVQEGDILTFVASQDVVDQDTPLFISGAARPERPPEHRTVFHIWPLKVGRVSRIVSTLQQIFRAEPVIQPGALNNTIVVRGTPDKVRRVITMIEALDRPLMQGQRAVVVDPVFLSAEELADSLTAVLDTEGYAVGVRAGGTGAGVSVVMLPLGGRLIVFARDQDTLDHIEAWARTLDARQEAAIEEGWFSYQIQHIQGEQLVETLEQLFADGVSSRFAAAEEPLVAQPPQPEESRALGGTRFVVDKNRNVLLFRGAGREWTEILGIIDELDRPVPSVAVEVLIAEVTLTNKEESGLEFIASAGLGGGQGLSGGTLGAFGLKSGGLSLSLDSAGQTRAVLAAFYEQSRVVIRASTSLTVKSGESASFNAGSQIPTIVASAPVDVQSGGTTSFAQSVSYRNTGVTITVEPVVQANGLVDLTISQELSEARPTAATSLTGSPAILNRSLQTVLTLRDGVSVLMGGLTSNNQSAGEHGVPGIGKVPLLGRLFRRDTMNQDRTELVVMVIPYVLVDYDEAREYTERIRDNLGMHREWMER